MKNHKSVFIKSAYLLALLLICNTASNAFAQEVLKKSASKGTVTVSAPSGEKIKKGTQACFPEAKNPEGPLCGKVTKASSTKITVTFEDVALVKKIKKGQKVTFGDATASAGGEAAAGEAAPAKAGSGANSTILRAIWEPAIMGPVKYGKAIYAAPASADSKELAPLWQAPESVSSSFIAFGANATVPIGSFAIIPGGRYRKYTSTTLEGDYDPASKSIYSTVTQEMSAFGGFLDFRLFNMGFGGGKSCFYATSGLDMEISSLTTLADKVTTTETTPLVTANSKASVISLRLGGGSDIMFMGSAGVNVGLTLLIPFLEMGKSIEAEINDGQSSHTADEQADLTAAIGHGKSGFGLELAFGLSYAL